MMHFRKMLLAITSTVIVAGCVISASAEDAVETSSLSEISTNAYYAEQLLDTPLSPGIRVMAYDNPMILSAPAGENIQFSAEVFDDYGGYVPSSVKILSLPDESKGDLIYNSNAVKEGQSISVLSLSALYFIPKGSEDAEFTFSADNTNVMRCILRQQNAENSKPYVKNNNSVTTYTNVNTTVAGYFEGSDIDGDALSYEIVTRPSKGIVSVNSDSSGQFIYSPYIGMSGSDTFSYRICDSYGNYSDICSVNVKIDPSKANAYDDTKESYFTSAINDVVASGIMQTSKNSDGEYFYPTEPVSRIDFLIMAMKTFGADNAEPTDKTVFSDDDTLSDTEKGYLAAAYNLGIIKGSTENGRQVFMPDEAITGASAAVILNGILGLPESESIPTVSMCNDVPAWARPSFSALSEAGIVNPYLAPSHSVLSRETVAVILSQLLHKLA